MSLKSTKFKIIELYSSVIADVSFTDKRPKLIHVAKAYSTSDYLFELAALPWIITFCFSGYYSRVKGQEHCLQHKLRLALYGPAHSLLVA